MALGNSRGAFGLPGQHNTPMKWNKKVVDGRQVEYRARLWHGNFIGYYVRSKSEGIEKIHVNRLLVDEAIQYFLGKFSKIREVL